MAYQPGHLIKLQTTIKNRSVEKNYTSVFIAALVIITVLLLCPTSCVHHDQDGIYIAVDGDNKNSGTEDSPYASIDRAMEEVRRLKRESDYPKGGLKVWFREGEYRIENSVVMNEVDGGLPDALDICRLSRRKGSAQRCFTDS